MISRHWSVALQRKEWEMAQKPKGEKSLDVIPKLLWKGRESWGCVHCSISARLQLWSLRAGTCLDL